MTENRPWGSFTILSESPNLKCKTITVNPGGKLSYQFHYKRSENWYISSGAGIVTINDEAFHIQAGQHVFIPALAKHRMYNPNAEPLIFIEIQTGSYFGEDDIVRISDDYGI